MPNHQESSVFIMIDTPTFRNVVDCCDYQQLALNNYIDCGFTDAVEYGTDTEVCFSISRFDYVSKGLSGEYNDVYNYIREDGTVDMISRNHKKLTALCGFLNRVIEYSDP